LKNYRNESAFHSLLKQDEPFEINQSIMQFTTR